MEITIPIGTEVKIYGNPILFKVVNKTNGAKYQLTNLSDNMPHITTVTGTDLVIVNNRELYKKVIEQRILTKKDLVKRANQDIKTCNIILDELEKFSSDETELLDFIDKFKKEPPSTIQKILKRKEHINFGKFLGEWT